MNTYLHELLFFLHQNYPNPQCALNHQNAFELLIATILAAQCTDERINSITPKLFSYYPTPLKLSQAPMDHLEALIFSSGFYKAKAKNIKAASLYLVERHQSHVPDHFEKLLQLPGVGRKTASVVLGIAFGQSTMVVDTHVKRLSYRLGLTHNTDPAVIESDLKTQIPKQLWVRFALQLVDHGRKICDAKKPLCIECGFNSLCPKKGVKKIKEKNIKKNPKS